MSVIDSVLPNTGLDADVLYRQPFKIKIKHCFYWKDDSSTPVGVLLKKRQPIWTFKWSVS